MLRDYSRFAPSQWDTALLCNDVSQWLGASLELALMLLFGWTTPVLLFNTTQTQRGAKEMIGYFPGRRCEWHQVN